MARIDQVDLKDQVAHFSSVTHEAHFAAHWSLLSACSTHSRPDSDYQTTQVRVTTVQELEVFREDIPRALSGKLRAD